MAEQTLPATQEPSTAALQQPKRKSLNESKSSFEILFKSMYLGASVLSAVLLHKVYLFQTLPEFADVRHGAVSDLLLYGLPFGVLYTILDLAAHYIFDDYCAEHYIDEKKYQGKAKQKRAYTIVKWIFSLFYYLTCSIFSIYLIKDTSYFPTWLGGNGQCINLVKGSPHFPEATFGMKVFYLVQFGKHASRLLCHMFLRPEGNYYEFLLHHALSTFLIIFSFLTNQWLVGIMVLFCHDISDFFLIMARGYRDYKNYSRTLLKIIYVPAAVFWIGGRLILFPLCCMYPGLVGPGIVEPTLNELQKDVMLLPFRWMGYMLVGLFFLQIFWTYYIMRAFVSVNVSTKVSNSYE